MSKTITIEKFSRYLGEHERMSSEEKIAHAKHLMFLHKDGLKYGKTDNCRYIKKRVNLVCTYFYDLLCGKHSI